MPDYAKCLVAKNNARSEADASFVLISLERSFSESEIKAELLEISERGLLSVSISLLCFLCLESTLARLFLMAERT